MKGKLVLLLMVIFSLMMGFNQSELVAKNINAQNIVIICGPKSPASIPFLRMKETKALGDDVQIEVEIYGSMEKMMAVAGKNNYGFLKLPVHVAAILYNKGFDVQLLNVGVWGGGMCLVTTDPDCNKWKDLQGKKLYVPSKNSPPDIVTQQLLKRHGLNAKEDVEIVYSNHVEIAQLLETGKAKYAIDVEPFVTNHREQNKKYKVISNLRDEWMKNENNWDLPSFGVIINNQLLLENKRLVEKFNQEYKKSMEWTVANPAQAGELAEKYLHANKKLLEKAMNNFGFIFKSATEGKNDIEKYYDVLFDFKPQTIGGKNPDENFYYQKDRGM